jgi:hypothetical protein
MFTRIPAGEGDCCCGGRLQAVSWFVTTVKHGTALEALARRESRWDILDIRTSCETCSACECEFASHLYSLPQTYKPTSDGSVAAITAGGELHERAEFGIT